MIQIVRTDQGKPKLYSDLDGGISVSLAHDNRFCLAVAGEHEQGVDLELVTNRSQQDWHALLGARYHRIFSELCRLETIDRAGTRIWTVLECLYKARGVRTADISIFRQADDIVVFSGSGEQGDARYVLTVPMTFTLGTERMLAMVVQPEAEAENARAAPGLDRPAAEVKAAGVNYSSYTMAEDQSTRQFLLRWPLTFKEAANLDKTVYFTDYPDWMGKVREMAMQPIAQPLSKQLASGDWGMVTNASEVWVLGEAGIGDVIEARLWVQPAPQQPESTIDLHFEWRRIGRDNQAERIAIGEMRVTWVELLGHGQVRASALPGYFRDFVASRTPPGGEHGGPDALTEQFNDHDFGLLHYRRPQGPASGPILARSAFATCLQDANMIGNLYFANYYIWQARLTEYFVQPIIPDFFRDAGTLGGLRCIRARVDHLHDAMPFEQIELAMCLEALYDNALMLSFTHYRVNADGTKQKLAVGSQECVWLDKQDGASMPGKLPAALIQHIKMKI